MPLQTGQMLSHYRLVEKIGEGGMGVVFRGLDVKLEREVAIKILRPELAHDPDRLVRFEREAKAVAALNHPNIASIYQIDEVDGITFIAMELVEGTTLRTLTASRPLSIDMLLDLSSQIADALDAAHLKGIVHRDIKPANILLDDRGRVKILDFGLAKLTVGDDGHDRSNIETAVIKEQLTTPGSTLGTIAYMSPEQVRGEELDTRTDLFSFGAVLYEMATGRDPFTAATPGLIFDSILNKEPTPADLLNENVPPRLLEIISKSLEKDRDLRYQSAAEIRADLTRLKRDSDSGRAWSDATTPPRQRPRGAGRPLPRFLAKLAVLIAVLSGACLALYLILSSGPAIPTTGAIDSVAVLPFENSGSQADDDALCDGLTESLINRLSTIPDLRVVPRSLVFPFKGSTIDPHAVARQLNVRAVVTGRVSRRGDTLVVGAELIDVARLSQIWGQQYNRTMTDIFSLQEEIAKEIAGNLRLQLSPAEERRLARRYTEDAEAYQLYIKSLQQMRGGSGQDLERAIDYAESAIVKDLRHRGGTGEPGEDEEMGFALAYALLARIYTLQAFAGYASPREVLPKARGAAEFALRIDDALGEAHGALAFVKLFDDWDWAGAEREFRKALELAPNDDGTHRDYSWYLMAMGRVDDAIQEMTSARDLDPQSDENRGFLAMQYFVAGRYEDARTEAQKTLEINPEFANAKLVLAYVHSSLGEHRDALIAYDDYLYVAEKESPLSPTAAYFHAVAGREEEARRMLEEAPPGAISPVQAAWVQAALGEVDEAFRSLERAYEQRAINLLWIRVQPWFDPLRDDPRFDDLLERMRLPS